MFSLFSFQQALKFTIYSYAYIIMHIIKKIKKKKSYIRTSESVGRYQVFSCQSPMNAICWLGSRVLSVRSSSILGSQGFNLTHLYKSCLGRMDEDLTYRNYTPKTAHCIHWGLATEDWIPVAEKWRKKLQKIFTPKSLTLLPQWLDLLLFLTLVLVSLFIIILLFGPECLALKRYKIALTF